jgi:hypothetical protein
MNDTSSERKKGGVISTAEVVDIYDHGVWVDNAVLNNGGFRLTLPNVSIGTHAYTAKVAGVESSVWDVDVIFPPFLDYTDFHDQNWNGWSKGPAGSALELLENYLRNWTYDNSSAGVVLKKTISGLIVGRRYRFEIFASQYVTAGKVQARLSLSTSAGSVTEVFIPLHRTYQAYGGEFDAIASSMEFRINSHEASGIGNDYYLKNLKIAGL